MRQLSRREFLELAARQSVGASVAASALLASCVSTADQASALGLDSPRTNTLIALIDEIIPPADGAPAASEVGTLAYFELLAATDPGLSETLKAAIGRVDGLSQARFAQGLSALGTDRRGTVLAAFAEADQPLFAALRNYVYEGYYLQPRVWQLLGYEPYPTLAPGPRMTPFDATLLNRVRAMPRRYREA